MPVKLHNTLTRTLDIFKPIDPHHVTLYTCGPTVYARLHVGNWGAYIYWDTLVRTLLSAGYTVDRVMNITDVGHLVSDADEGEDKMEKGARREGKTAWDIAEFYAEDFVQGLEKLGMIPPTHLIRATDFIPQQLDLVRILKEKGYTYQTSDGIYFDTSKFPTYANFAQLDLEAQRAGARVEANEEKRQPWDFALWKFTPAGQKRDMEWETPNDLLDNTSNNEPAPLQKHLQPEPQQAAGLPETRHEAVSELKKVSDDNTQQASTMGFPGWHLECSAMAMSILGPTIDIHTGGIDHIPVHHTNEIAQSEAASGQQFAHYWLHNNHLKIDGTKVSKSLGNTYTLQQLAERGYSPMDLRMFTLQSHYRSEGNFTFASLDAAKNRLESWRGYAALRHQTHDRLEDDIEKNDNEHPTLLAAIGAVKEALYDDLGTPTALRIVDEAFSRLDALRIEDIHRFSLVEFITTIDELLGLSLADSTPDIDDETKKSILERSRAREDKDWRRSDELRDKLAKKGVVVHDTPSGPIWSYAA